MTKARIISFREKASTIQYGISDIGRLDGNRVFRIKRRTNALIKKHVYLKNMSLRNWIQKPKINKNILIKTKVNRNVGSRSQNRKNV